MTRNPGDLFDAVRRIAESLRSISRSTEEMSELKRLSPLQLAGFRKYGDWLYGAEYNNIDYDYAIKHYESIYVPTGACTAVRSGDIIGRNFDWDYNEGITLVMHTAPGDGRYGVWGTCSAGPGLTKTLAESGQFSEAYKLAPFHLADGVNSEGLYCNINVVSADESKGRTTGTVPTEEQRDRICMPMLVRYILDHYDSVDEALDGITKYVSVWTPEKEGFPGEFHFLLADSTKTVVLEFVDNEPTYTEVGPDEDYPAVMANFYVDGVTPNDDGSITRNTDSDTNVNGVTPFGQGIERHNIAVAGIENADDVAGMKALMRSLFYTQAYTLESNKWYSEFTGGDLKVTSPADDFSTIMSKAADMYAHRSRHKGDANYGTWQTTHSIIYDLENGTMDICVQEENSYKTFTFSA